ncbi:MAG: flagellar protein FlgN [Nitrosomonadales bacterium]|nr:flagellar protein FlgN [Nitrosomonadales bacterium]
MAAIPQLVAALAAEHSALLEFLALLEREQAMLIENRIDQLLDLSEQKSTDALNLDQLAETRRTLLQNNILRSGIAPAGNAPKSAHPLPDALDADAILAWLGKHSPEGLSIWQNIRDLAYRAQQLNRTNGELIQMKLRYNQQTLAVLSKAADKANLYGPDGQHNFTPGSGRSLGSG